MEYLLEHFNTKDLPKIILQYVGPVYTEDEMIFLRKYHRAVKEKNKMTKHLWNMSNLSINLRRSQQHICIDAWEFYYDLIDEIDMGEHTTETDEKRQEYEDLIEYYDKFCDKLADEHKIEQEEYFKNVAKIEADYAEYDKLIDARVTEINDRIEVTMILPPDSPSE